MAICDRCLERIPSTDVRSTPGKLPGCSMRATCRGRAVGCRDASSRGSPSTVWWLRGTRRRIGRVPAPSTQASGSLELHQARPSFDWKQRGTRLDWSKSARIVTEVPGEVHCFSVIDAKTALIVWGTPRHAEEVNLASGRRQAAHLAPETFRVGCPEFSPNRRALLFTGQTQAGAPEIRMSQDGRPSTTVTSGADPRWLGGNEEFLYEVDSSHAGLFSLATMSFTLLGDAPFGRRHMILGNAASPKGDVVALLLGNDSSEYGIAIYEGRPFEAAKVFSMPIKYQIQFEPETDAILVSHHTTDGRSALAQLDWRHEKLWNVGKYTGFDSAWATFPQAGTGEKVLVARHSSSDVWLVGRAGKERLTNDGEDYSADISPTGDLLISRRGTDGQLAIWWRGQDGREKKLTAGPRDVEPTFSHDGQSWTYSDYATKSVVLCSVATEKCRVVHQDEFLPGWPTLSPDGTSIAYLTQVNGSRVVIVSASDGHPRKSWDAFYQCAPVWSSSTTILYLEALSGHYSWSERNVLTGEKTGKRIAVPAENMAIGEIECGSASPESPLFRPIRVEKAERSRILVLK